MSGKEKKRNSSDVSSQSDNSFSYTQTKNEKTKQKPNENSDGSNDTLKIIQSELKLINKKLENVMTKNDETLVTLIKETIQTMKQELLASTEKKVEILEGKLFEKDKEIDKMKEEQEKMKHDIKNLRNDYNIQNENVDRYKQEMRHSALTIEEQLNKHEQYSRVNNIRISGIPEEFFAKPNIKNVQDTKNSENIESTENSEKNEDKNDENKENDTYAMKLQKNTAESTGSKDCVPENDEQTTEILLMKLNLCVPDLNLERKDIVISHRLGKRGERPRPIIAQFKSRLDKNKIMRNRKLFPQSISITDDLTPTNYKTLQSLKYKKPDLVQAACIRNGKIFFKDYNEYVTLLQHNRYSYWINLPWPERVQGNKRY